MPSFHSSGLKVARNRFYVPLARAQAHGHSSLRGRLCAHTEGENGVEGTAIQSLSVIPGMMGQRQSSEGKHSMKGW